MSSPSQAVPQERPQPVETASPIPPQEKPSDLKPETADPAQQPDSGQQGAKFGDISNSSVWFQQNQKYKSVIVGDPLLHLSMFNWRDGLVIGRAEEQTSSASFVYESGFVDSSLAALGRGRVLIIKGEVDCGKESMARYLANRLREDGVLQQDTILYSPPKSDVRLALLAEIKRKQDLQGRVLIFRDALDHGNPGLIEFLMRLKGEAAVANVARELEQVSSYLIFTAAKSSLPPDCAGSLPAWMSPELRPISQELLLKGVERAVSECLRKEQEDAAWPAVTKELVQEIAARAGSMARAVRFIDSRLVSILRGEGTVAKAFDELDALSTWFQRCPTPDREAWIYCLALILAQSLGRNDEVPWSEFSSLYDPLRTHVLRWRGIKVARRQIDEQILQDRGCVVVTRDTVFARDLLAFRDTGDASRLWSVLLGRCRSLAGSLVPVLLRLTQDEAPMVRARAAQALGRIGGLDSPTMMTRWLADWADSESWKERSLAGYLAQGVVSTGDSAYREILRNLAERYARHPTRAWTAIAIYKHIGALDLALALDKLRGIAETRLAPAFQAGRDIERKLQQLDRELAKIRTAEANMVRQVLPALGKFYAELLSDEAEIAQTFKYTLVSLCLTAGFASVIARLTAWALGSQGMEALVCIVFLQQDGIASELTERKVSLELNSGGEKVPCNVILASLIGDSEAIQIFARFLQTIYAGLLNFFPPDIALPMTHLIFDYLKTWVRDSLMILPCRIAMVELIGSLLKSNLKDLFERTYDWLASDPDFIEPDMAAFAKEARRFTA